MTKITYEQAKRIHELYRLKDILNDRAGVLANAVRFTVLARGDGSDFQVYVNNGEAGFFHIHHGVQSRNEADIAKVDAELRYLGAEVPE